MKASLSKNKCIIYSFGISNDWTFEDLMDSSGLYIYLFTLSKFYPLLIFCCNNRNSENFNNYVLVFSEGLGCQIFAHDHTINNVPSRRGEQIFYSKTGLGFGENLKSLSTLIAENKHKNEIIDYLKVYVYKWYK